MYTLLGLVPDKYVADVGTQLQESGIAVEDVHTFHRIVDVCRQLNGRGQVRTVAKDILIGAGGGAGIGLLYGVPAGILNCRLMACPVTTSLLMLALIMAYWMAAGAIIGLVIGFDQLNGLLRSYLRGIRRRETLLLVEAADAQTEAASQILTRAEGRLIHTRQ